MSIHKIEITLIFKIKIIIFLSLKTVMRITNKYDIIFIS